MFHLGYEFDENDAHDVKLLCETLHIEIQLSIDNCK